MGKPARGTVALLIALACVCVANGVAAYPLPNTRRVAYQRAVATYAAMLASFRQATGFSDEIAAARAGLSPAAHAWPVSQALAASIAMASIPHSSPSFRADVPAGLAALDAYWSPEVAGAPGGYASSALPPFGPGGEQFYDDNEWIGLDLLAAYRLHADPSLLRRARSIFVLVASGWATATAPCAGGIYWMRSSENRDRNAVSTLNGALLGLELHELTGALSYLDWARRMLTWTEQCLTRPDGLLADHLAADGSRDDRAWSYNQGAFIAASVLMAGATGDDRYLDRAERVATAALRVYRTAFAGEPPVFVAIFFRDLALLDLVRPSERYRAVLARYAELAWKTGRNAKTGLFSGKGTTSTLLDQAGMVQIYALLAGAMF